ncbi:efflux RND transporter periplasmic adaptor subunit [Abyssibacter profundi]|uniref:Efflux transporter periplasmic adaptor subunit n=1 Tax=Abyssibacter profundi TaxID=2182787 RepID=A0A363UP16_9GAMM|nr:efflux RND transporter periplasmic adaptor subunit [Abyssibacter profundi]MBV60272.1 efflux transporter periplasmic adaptor subunit [Nevskiales bacterium]PWN57182.1 efflux transporter periplasmic adaptor subunit [Abyssibacter profundi]
MTKRLIIVLLGLGLVFGGIFGFKAFMNAQMTKYFANMQPPPVTVTTTVAEESVWEPTIPAVGTLRAVNGVMVSAELPGVVENIAFDSGQRVQRGDLLVQLDTSTDRAQLAALEAQLRLARSDLQRQNELRRRGTNAQADLDAAKANAAQLEAQIESQKATIAKKAIKAPFDGEVGIRRVDIGQYVAAGTGIVSLQQLDPILVDFTLPEQRLGEIETGQIVRLTVSSASETAFTGHITAIEPSVDQATRNFAVEARVDNVSRRLRPGQFARLDVVLPQIERFVTLPATAITYNPYGDSIYRVDAGEAGEDGQASQIANRVFVELGERRGDQVAVLSGVSPGEEIVTSGQLKLRNGSRLNINNKVQPDNSPNPTPANK